MRSCSSSSFCWVFISSKDVYSEENCPGIVRGPGYSVSRVSVLQLAQQRILTRLGSFAPVLLECTEPAEPEFSADDCSI